MCLRFCQNMFFEKNIFKTFLFSTIEKLEYPSIAFSNKVISNPSIVPSLLRSDLKNSSIDISDGLFQDLNHILSKIKSLQNKHNELESYYQKIDSIPIY